MMRTRGMRLPLVVAAVFMLAAYATLGIFTQPVHAAAQITNRKLTLQARGAVGGSAPSTVGNVKHQFTFNLVSSTNVGSIKFEYCTIASGVCTLPTGVTTTSAAIDSQTGPATGFTINNSTNGAPYLTRTAAAVTPGTASVITLDNISNPTAVNYTFFVRISTYTATNGTGTAIDAGTVAASTANPIILSGTMPESLIFCTADDITVTSNIPDCSNLTDNNVDFDQLFGPTVTAFATSDMAASTNALQGYAITVAGNTLTNGSYTIPALATTTASQTNTGQFGLNLVANTLTSANGGAAFGSNVNPTSNSTDLRASPATNYATAGSFRFVSGDVVARSDNTTPGTAAPTNSQRYTVSYIVNVSGSQPAGTYTSTLTYVCTPTF